MSGDAELINGLVDRLKKWLPHNTWPIDHLQRDEGVLATRATLVQISSADIGLVLDSLLGVLEHLSSGFGSLESCPPHVLQSQQYVLSLIADCCVCHWRCSGRGTAGAAEGDGERLPLPDSLEDGLVTRIFTVLKGLLSPIPDGYVLPPRTIFDDISSRSGDVSSKRDDDNPYKGLLWATALESHENGESGGDLASIARSDLEVQVKTIVEYTTASSWACSFEYFRTAVYNVRASTALQTSTVPSGITSHDDKSALVVLYLVSFFWVDGQKLGNVIQEICTSFLHFRKSFQHTTAIVIPLLIIRWLDRFPAEFVQLHTTRRRLDGGADTLFDMTQTFADGGRRKALVYPLQTTLLFLLPDVFEVASNLRDMRGGSMSKKIAFLDGLRKALRNRSDQAGYCLVCLLRASRHFEAESEAAILSYAMDVQDEVRDAVFRRLPATLETPTFEQDMMTAAFVSLAHINLDHCVEALVPACLLPSAPLAFKLAAVQGCCYFARQNQPQRYRILLAAVVPFMQAQLNATGALVNTGSKVFGADPALTMTYNVMEFFTASPPSLLLSTEYPQSAVKNAPSPASSFISLVRCIISTDDTVQNLGRSVAAELLADESALDKLRRNGTLDSQSLNVEFWSRSSSVLLAICEALATTWTARWGLKTLHGYLQSRHLLLRHVQELSEPATEGSDVDTAAVSTQLEKVLLVSICSSVDIDTYRLLTTCMRLCLEEPSVVLSSSRVGKAEASLMRNSGVFGDIASTAYRFTGPVAFQKRACSLLRRLQSPTAGILAAWEAGFDRWIHLSKDVSTSAADVLDERVFTEWRNYSGFLAALGGICTAGHFGLEERPAAGLRWIDKLSSENNEEPVLGMFLRVAVQLLACSNFKVREATRETLSSEISPSLYQALFKALESQLEALFAGALASPEKDQENEVIFAEQASSLLRALVDRLETPADMSAAASVHLGAITLNFVKFLDGASDGPGTLRAKIKACQLCEVVTRKKEHLNLRDDFRIRNQLLDYVFNWIIRPRSPRPDVASSNLGFRQDEAGKLQKDLDRAGLQSLAHLTYRLPLQPAEGQADAASSDLKSQMFDAYFGCFLSLLNPESADSNRSDSISIAGVRSDGDSTQDLAITILSNILSANIDVGLKPSLGLGYHENPDIRAAFVMVLYNILIQGTEFSNIDDNAVMEKYDGLLEVLVRDMTLASSMSAACPSNEIDELSISLLTILESRGATFNLLETLLVQEIEDTENESQILRRNSVATKMLSIYAKWKGAPYLKLTLQKVLERLMLTANDLDLELDPARVSSEDELEKNFIQLKIVTSVFIDDICASSSRMPDSFRRICNMISSAVLSRFPEAKYTAVGAFIFLRFFCPAIVAPEAEGLVSGVPSKEMRRGLLLIAKVVQNLANNVLFGAKEVYMYPLNDFLAENIYRVTTFLREISAPIEKPEPPVSGESFDFGSCVTLHRFLYDYADQVHQKLLSQERRDYVRSPVDASRGRSPPVLENLRKLIANLGPPPLAVTWNRPQISANSLPVYSRFQNFMLRHASRSTESIATSRAVYDGGESKDGLPIVCIILRYIDTDSIDYDVLVHSYLKITSRMWHRPFGLFIDATCYGGQKEPPDELFRQLELLTPSELARHLSRVYIYNTNSVFRKCFRRLLRFCIKSDHSVFSPRNVEYNLLGSLQELKMHFHLGQLHLPKDTISVVTDTRYVFQSITKLSRSKGKVEVIVKVGGQFVQITTTERQELFSGFRLDTIINDIFQLGDIDEAPTSIQTEDDSAFGLRVDSGKIVMYFTSPKKLDVLETIRSAKAKYGKNSRSPKAFERLIRPQDVPGTLMNIALTNLSSPDNSLRLASYNLLGALCRAFKFEAASSLVCAKDILLPFGPSEFAIQISKQLSQSERRLTLDFITEFFVGWESFHPDHKPLSLAYMAPWIPGLRTAFLATESDGEKGREKIAALFRKLVEIAVGEQSMAYTLEQAVWPAISRDEVLLEIMLDELVREALAPGMQVARIVRLSSTAAAIGTMTLRGKVISRLRKALNRSSLRPTRSLPDNAVWSEVCVLLHFCVSLSFNHGVQAQLYLPEVFHIVTMLANTGASEVRLLVYRLLVNSVHAACSSFALDDARLHRLKANLDSLAEPRGDAIGGSSAALASSSSSVYHKMTTITMQAPESSPMLAMTESLTAMLFDICSIAAPTTNVMNMWRSRWMSLVASTAFQNNPAIQPRAFAVMGCLARDEVDDDLLYQVLVALRHSLGRYSDDGSSDMMVSVMSSLSKMMSKLPSASRYGLQLFWLAVSLLRLVPPALFNCSAQFLEAVLANNSTAGDFYGDRMVSLLLQGRSQIEDAALPLDDAYGIHFNAENFHWAVCTCVARGLTSMATRSAALKLLSTFLGMTAGQLGQSFPVGDQLPPTILSSPYFNLIMSRVASSEEFKEHLWLAGINIRNTSALLDNIGVQSLGKLKETDLLLGMCMSLVDFALLEDTTKSRILTWLIELAAQRPSVVLQLCGHIRSTLKLIMDESEPSLTLDSAHRLLRIMACTPKFNRAMASSTEVLDDLLEDMGFGGLWAACSWQPGHNPNKHHFSVTEKLIGLSLA